jgi:type II secretory pathway pseudopilin PulG
LRKANESPAEFGGRGLALGGIITSAVSVVVAIPLGIILAIAIPSFLRARISAGESGVIGDVRTVISAQFAYASANGGFFDGLECLAAPSDCLPDYPAGGPIFLGAEFLTPSSGVTSEPSIPDHRHFPSRARRSLPRVSPASLTWLYRSTPVKPACADSAATAPAAFASPAMEARRGYSAGSARRAATSCSELTASDAWRRTA